jgi:hypothetical protein
MGFFCRTSWEFVSDFGKNFRQVAGWPEHVDTILAIARIGVTIFAAESASSSQQPNAAAS